MVLQRPRQETQCFSRSFRVSKSFINKHTNYKPNLTFTEFWTNQKGFKNYISAARNRLAVKRYKQNIKIKQK